LKSLAYKTATAVSRSAVRAFTAEWRAGYSWNAGFNGNRLSGKKRRCCKVRCQQPSEALKNGGWNDKPTTPTCSESNGHNRHDGQSETDK